MDAKAEKSNGKSAKYNRRRQAIVDAAVRIINDTGLKGMRLAEVAESLGLGATAITYYFRKRDDLAVACFDAALQAYHGFLDAADDHTGARDRVRAVLHEALTFCADVRNGVAEPIVGFSDVRGLGEPHREVVLNSYRGLFYRIRSLVDTPDMSHLDAEAKTIRAQILLELLYWLMSIQSQYELHQFDRLEERFFDIIANGLAKEGAEWTPGDLDVIQVEGHDDPVLLAFYQSAIKIINDTGYRDASVERISASLNLTKGAFYHHMAAKGELVRSCFEYSLGVMLEIQRQSQQLDGSEWERLITACAGVVRYQISESGPLLRTSALVALPNEDRDPIDNLVRRVNRGFAAMLSDAIAEGTARPVDPYIASYMLHGMLNAAADLPTWRTQGSWKNSPPRYARPFILGMLR